VTFTGAVGQDEIHDYYERAAVFCSPSLAEGIPFVLMEAMAMELPVVASRIAGIPELVEDGVAGLLVPPGRADLLADALEDVLRDPERAQAMGRAGRQRVVEQFDVDRSAERLAELFAAVGGDG
jgi:colanic acid/amylovoran biosynthesis glycosyltransferase